MELSSGYKTYGYPEDMLWELAHALSYDSRYEDGGVHLSGEAPARLIKEIHDWYGWELPESLRIALYGDEVYLQSLTVAQLKDEARERGLTNYSRHRKAELIKMILVSYGGSNA